LAERQDLNPAIVLVGILAGVEDDGFLQSRSEPVLQKAQAVQVFAADASSGLELEGYYLAIVAFEHEVYLVTRLGPEMSGRYGGV
jgi:hypothetical protein